MDHNHAKYQLLAVLRLLACDIVFPALRSIKEAPHPICDQYWVKSLPFGLHGLTSHEFCENVTIVIRTSIPHIVS